MKRLPMLIVLSLAVAACSAAKPASGPSALVLVNVPLVKAGAVAEEIVRGAQLAAEEINASGGIAVGNQRVRLDVRAVDSQLSPSVTAANTREAVRVGAAGIVDEGTGVDASWQIAAAAGIPIGIVYQGAMSLVDARTRPNVFRIAPTNRGIAFRLAEYLIPKGLRIAILRDDSTYGEGGGAALHSAFQRNESSVTTSITIPASATSVSAQVLAARRSGATALLVWTRPAMLAQIVREARSRGWMAPVYTPTSGEDAIVRQQLADHPDWVDGLTFTGSRLTSEKGTAPFTKFRTAYEKRYGAERVGVTSKGKAVIQAPDWAMYSYDFVKVLAGAMARAGVATPGRALVAQLNDVDVPGANGDERSFNERNHEGVVDDDVFFATFRNMVWTPVRDDPLSATLPPIKQTL